MSMNCINKDIIDNDPRQNEIKICSNCGAHKKRNLFPISKVKSNGTVIRRTCCKDCEKDRQLKIRRKKGIESNLIPIKIENDVTLYQCNLCNTFKPKNGFPKDNYKTNTIGISRPCKECRKHIHETQRIVDVTNFLSESQEEEHDKHYGSINRIKQQLINLAKNRAKNNGLKFDLTVDDFDIPEICPILGIKIIPGIGKQSPNSPSLDRIDSSNGYIKSNVCVISYRANAMKNDASSKELESFANNIMSYIKMKR